MCRIGSLDAFTSSGVILSKCIIPDLCGHPAGSLRSDCLAAWVEEEGEGEGGPERPQRAPEAVSRQGGGAQEPEGAWRKVLRAAS